MLNASKREISRASYNFFLCIYKGSFVEKSCNIFTTSNGAHPSHNNRALKICLNTSCRVLWSSTTLPRYFHDSFHYGCHQCCKASNVHKRHDGSTMAPRRFVGAGFSPSEWRAGTRQPRAAPLLREFALYPLQRWFVLWLWCGNDPP